MRRVSASKVWEVSQSVFFANKHIPVSIVGIGLSGIEGGHGVFVGMLVISK
jgi:hypothetical protein